MHLYSLIYHLSYQYEVNFDKNYVQYLLCVLAVEFLLYVIKLL